MVDTANITVEDLENMSASEVDDLLDSLQRRSKKADSVSQMEDIGRGLRRVPGVLAGLPGDVETLGRMGVNLLRSSAPEGVTPLPPISTDSFIPNSQDITSGIQENLGIDQTPPETALGRISELVGTGGAFGLARGGVGLLRGAANPVTAVTKPVAAETLVAAGAGAGGETARGLDMGGGGQFAGELAGGVGTAGLAQLATRLGRGGVNLGSNILAIPKTTIGQTTLPVGAANIASDVMRELSPGDVNLASLTDPNINFQTIADQLDSPVLKAVERSLQNEGGGRTLAQATAARDRSRAFNQGRVDQVEQSLRVEGRPEEYITGVKERMQEFNDNIAKDIAAKGDDVEAALNNVGSEASITEQSIAARRSIENNLKDARKVETEAWDEVKDIADNTTSDVTPIVDSLTATLQDQPANISPDRMIPTRIVAKTKRLGKKTDGMETLTELQAFRSDILDEARTARTEGRFDQARKLTDLQETVLNVMDAADTQGLLKKARIQSRALNDTFQRGEIGKVLGLVGDAEDRVSDLRTLEAILSPGGGIGAQGDRLTKFLIATGTEGVDQAEEFLRSKFQKAAINEAGDVDLAAAASFNRVNEGALEQLPFLRREIEDGVNAAKRLERQIAFRSKSTKSVNERTQSAKILGASPDRAVAEVLRGKPFRENSKRELTKLFRLAETPAQKRGLSRAVYDYVADQSLKTTQDGTRKIDFNTLNKNMSALAKSGFFQGTEFNRIKGIAKEMQRIDRLKNRSLNTSLSLQSESLFTDIVASVLGARVGASVGGATAGGSIQTAGRTAGLARKLVASMDQAKIISVIEEAIYDPDVYRTLMSRKTAKNDLIKATKLRGYMLDLSNDLPQEEEQ